MDHITGNHHLRSLRLHYIANIPSGLSLIPLQEIKKKEGAIIE
jgi:hypothetical protein